MTPSGEPTGHWLETKIPPPIVVLLIALLMWWIAKVTPHARLSHIARLNMAVVLALCGVAFAISGVIAFRRWNTTVRPEHPEKTTALVNTGPYRYSRNPMYLGMLVILLAWTIYLAAPWSVLGLVAFVLYITCFQIIPEERALAAKFGADFQRFCGAFILTLQYAYNACR
jgi:protein-S-isoprenylcysteine O-methyltransferase Ste14